MAPDRFTLGALAAATALSAACLAVLGVRLAQSGEPTFAFLSWNLFLAWIPLVVAALLPEAGTRAARWATVPALTVWLLFLPNAPYLVTDLIHLSGRPAGAPAIALAMLPAFAAAGLLIGGLGHHLGDRALAARAGPRAAAVATAACIALAGVGMYLGRVLQWNSWDLLTRPGSRLAELAARLADPWALAGAVAVSAAAAGGGALAFAAVRSAAGHAARRA